MEIKCNENQNDNQRTTLGIMAFGTTFSMMELSTMTNRMTIGMTTHNDIQHTSLSIMELSIMALSIMTLGIITFGRISFIKTELSILAIRIVLSMMTFIKTSSGMMRATIRLTLSMTHKL
jgi:hypothetical protein